MDPVFNADTIHWIFTWNPNTSVLKTYVNAKSKLTPSHEYFIAVPWRVQNQIYVMERVSLSGVLCWY